MNFSKELQKHVKNHGWKPNRKDFSNKTYMEQNNYPQFIQNFMFEYGKLKISDFTPEIPVKSEVTNHINFDISKTEGIHGISEGYAEQLGRKLYPIAYYTPESYDVSIDENGYVYLLGEYAFCCGKELYKGIENIIRMRVFDTLELDPANDDDEIWLEYKKGISTIVNLETYNFRYNF
ncbi:SUKH-3 domain-containing protein [uncultured Kordia sp.]|uniref:SUKH-3 domain-containing protein n=1 Tax=uncultured Kordia sp. TaxID=507699 RepID=UPI0026399C52|nr:SUKH-3 domain-containing protein [uncultured Kordia sp.]